jgi:hypothetical protein
LEYCDQCGHELSDSDNFCTNCGTEFSNAGVANSLPSLASSILEKYKFFKIGTFYKVNDSVGRRTEPGINVTTRLPIVYALVAGDQVMYIGETIQGYIRPLNYHKNEVMSDVRNGIISSISQGLDVDVFARSEDLEFEFEGLLLNLRVSLEAALIKKYLPPWNNKIED